LNLQGSHNRSTAPDLTPHLAWYSEHSQGLAGEKAAQDIIRVFKGYFTKYLVNAELIKTRPDLKQPDD
jgi:phosphoglycerate dehydrogenase-like enzyme